jgi:cell division protease FtsH
MTEDRRDQKPEKSPFSQNWLGLLVVLATLGFVYYALWHAPSEPGAVSIAYSEFKSLVGRGEVAEVRLRGSEARGRLRSRLAIGPGGQQGEYFITRIPEFGDRDLLPLLEGQDVGLSVEEEAARSPLVALVIAVLPWILLLGFFYFIFQRTSRSLGGRLGSAGELKSFLESPARKGQVPEVTFADVAGQENAKREITELVAFLKNPDFFRRLGAEVPRGVLLMGPPGTGKTLLAKALAGEAGVPFFSISGSEFIEVFVGVGAARVRSLFDAAKKNAPSIIFVDELDSVGRTRGTGLGGGHDEREQTLNQILAELDGFTGRESVIVLAATNRPDVLDPALLRPGRFDRHVMLDLPTRAERVAILGVHTRKMPIADDVDMERIAAGTPGFSGADIKNLANEAAMNAARERHDEVTMHDFDEARDKLLMGTVRTLAIQPEERHRLAVHESGHALVAYYTPRADPLYKVSIIPRGRALGGTQQLPEAERHTLPEEYLRDRLAVILGGRTAEKALLDSVSSGADDDIRQATALARAMVSRWGMSEDIGPVDLRESEEHPFLGREIAQPRRYSEHSARHVDEAVKALLLEAEQSAAAMLREHRKELAALIALLEERETLERPDIEQCLGPVPARRELDVVGHE